jgi:hypothetical protein
MATQNIRNKYSCVNDQMRDQLNDLIGDLPKHRAPAPPVRRKPKRKTIQFESMAELMEHEDQKKLIKALAESYKV